MRKSQKPGWDRVNVWPGDVVGRAGGDAGLHAVWAVHAERVKAVVTVTHRLQIDIGLGGGATPELGQSRSVILAHQLLTVTWDTNRTKIYAPI